MADDTNKPLGADLRQDLDTHRRWLQAFSALAIEQLEGMESAPACGTVGAEGHERAAELSVPIGEDPLAGGVDAVVDILRGVIPLSFNTPGPGYLAYVPGGGLFSSALADLVGGVANRFTSIAPAAPGFTRLEQDVLAFLAREFGYPSAARGLLTPGGSMANFAAVVSARHHHLGDEGDYRKAVAYTSSQAHHSVAKSLRLAGIPARNVRLVDVDESWAMRPDRLARQIEADRASGLRPFLVVCAAGTTNTGAVDPMNALADLCEEHELWLHVDGAYGGAFVLCDRGRAVLAGIDRADSITFDPHKGMFVPYGTGCLLVRDGERLRRAHQLDADYLQDLEREIPGMPPSPSEYGPELSRDNRGIRLWVPLMLHGVGAFRRALEEKMDQAALFEAGLRGRIDAGAPLEIVAPAILSTVAFRLRRGDREPLDDWNARNAKLMADINGRQRVYLSSTALPIAASQREPGDPDEPAAFTLRVCVLSFRTPDERLDACLQDLDAVLADA